jgi:hypothetical protein
MFTGEQEQKHKRQFHQNCQGLFNQINPWDWIVPHNSPQDATASETAQILASNPL